jgi:hypothetical protein
MTHIEDTATADDYGPEDDDPAPAAALEPFGPPEDDNATFSSAAGVEAVAALAHFVETEFGADRLYSIKAGYGASLLANVSAARRLVELGTAVLEADRIEVARMIRASSVRCRPRG